MIADITYCPFRYNPVTDELQLLTEAILNVNYQSGLSDVVYLSSNQLNIFSEDVKTMVDNPEVVDINSPFLNTEISGLVEYAIITPQELVSSFESLIEWKNQRGIRANIFSKEWILLNYSGYYDDMECIREFIKDLYANHGLIYVILAGDFDNLGARLVPINFQETNYNSPCDCYFSDLDSNWDGNGNHIYGEWQVDGCDWRSDVYVSRFPINTNDEVNRWINKLIKYEKDPCTNYFERSLMAGTEINGNLNWYGDTICDSIVDNHLPDHWHSVKMYQTESYTPPGFIDSFNTGYNWCYICSHGNITKTYWNDYPDIADILSTACNITNGEKLGILHSSACNPGYFDNHECLAEYVFNSPGGGAIAIIMNAREGLWAPPSIGPSCWIDIKLATFIFDQEKWNIGISHAFAKEFLLSWMNFGENDHFAFIENTLFGDPETQLYTSEPIQLYGEHDTVIYMGEGQFTISLSAEDNPISGVTCCLYRTGNHDIWFRDTTNNQAVATINYEITSPGDLLVTAYDHNYRCYIDIPPPLLAYL